MKPTPQEKIDVAQKLIEQEQAKIAQFEIEKARAYSSDPTQVATWLHEVLCTANHTDECSFGYGRYDNPRPKHYGDETMRCWLNKANFLMTEAARRGMTVVELVEIARLVMKSEYDYK